MKIKLQKTVFLPDAILLFLIFMLTASPCLAGIGAWTWMSGSDTTNQSGSYGTKGEPSDTNIPRARQSSISWTDDTGDLWLFGGFGYDSAVNYGNLNDLWRYSTDNNTWTWMSGSDTTEQSGSYGTQGEPSDTNIPGARLEGISWTDQNGDLWLFGGRGYDSAVNYGNLNDLWRYSTDNNTWTWMSGSDTTEQSGSYGNQGEPSETNIPGARLDSISWTDQNGDLWLFGGNGRDSAGTTGHLNDLWRYDVDNGTWTWMSGDNETGQPGSYGSKGTPNPNNVPGARSGSTSWKDGNGDLWLFGGLGFDSDGREGELNDLWRYDPENDTWLWINGSDTTNQSGSYGTQGEPSDTNTPGARASSISWTDDNGDFWLFGGAGYDSAGSYVALNDLWRYSTDNNTWTWMDGSNVGGQPGSYGTQGEFSDTNIPGARLFSISWTDQNGALWLFGGYGYDSVGSYEFLNDLWRYKVVLCETDTDCFGGICMNEVCVECTGDDDCFDGVCVDYVCVECRDTTDCDNGVYCDGAETCDAGMCAAGTDPCPEEVCDEQNLRCVECLEDSDCGDFYTCESNVCVAFPTFSSVTEVTLKGPGELDVIFDPNKMDIARIELTNTTKKSSLEISSMLKNSFVLLDQLAVNGTLNSIKGKSVFLTGELTSTGGIDTIQIAGTEPGSLIDAPWIGSLRIATDFAADMVLTGIGAPKGITLKKADIKGMLWMSEWLISGDVGSVKVTFWGPGSTLAVGVDPGSDGEFFTGDDIATGGLLGGVKYKDYENYNAGDAFGIIADEFSKLKINLPFRDDDFHIQER